MKQNDLIVRPIAGREELDLFTRIPYVLNEELGDDLDVGSRQHAHGERLPPCGIRQLRTHDHDDLALIRGLGWEAANSLPPTPAAC